MSDRIRQYTPSPIPVQVDATWLRQEFARLSQALALINQALADLETRLQALENE